MVAGQGRPGGNRPAGERECLYRSGNSAPRAAPADHLRRDQEHAPNRTTPRCRPGRGSGGTTRAPSRVRNIPVHCRCPADPTTARWSPGRRRRSHPGVDIPGEQVILDCNARAEGHDFYSLGGLEISPDGALMAFLEDVTGDERFTLRYRRPRHRRVPRRRGTRAELRHRASPTTTACSTSSWIRPGARTRSVDTSWARPRRRTAWCSPSPTSDSGSASTPSTDRAYLLIGVALADDQRGVRPAVGRPDRRTGERRAAPGRRRVPRRSRHDRRSRGVRGGAQRQCRGLRRRPGRGRRPRPGPLVPGGHPSTWHPDRVGDGDGPGAGAVVAARCGRTASW